MLDITNHQENANPNFKEVLPHTGQRTLTQYSVITYMVKDSEKEYTCV